MGTDGISRYTWT